MKNRNIPGYRTIFFFWSPLALTWLMMALEGPFLAAVIARLADPKANLAAYGVAFAIAIIIEAPVIMIMSASTALAKDWVSYTRLRNFTHAMNLAITLVMAGLLFTDGMEFINISLIGLPENVAALVHNALLIMLPWPAAIGFRRFYQGLLIRGGQTRKVAYGTAVRLSTMCLTGAILYFLSELPGACVGAAALSVGVTLEAVAARIMAIDVVRSLKKEGAGPIPETETLSYREIGRFYYPLALTSTIALAAHPMVTFFVGQARLPLESLAVLPVVNSLVFLFRALCLSYQEAAITLVGDKNDGYEKVRNFAVMLGLLTMSVLCLIAFTPLSGIWFRDISGLNEALADFAACPTMILAFFPVLSALLSFQRALLIKSGKTGHVTAGTIIEVGCIVMMLMTTIHLLDMTGAVAAAISLLAGRFACNCYLVRPCLKASKPPGAC